MADTNIGNEIADWVVSNFRCPQKASEIPRDESLVEVGIIDSYGVVELVEYMERNWNITIADDEITREKMGSINRMAALIEGKLAHKKG